MLWWCGEGSYDLERRVNGRVALSLGWRSLYSYLEVDFVVMARAVVWKDWSSLFVVAARLCTPVLGEWVCGSRGGTAKRYAPEG